MNFNEYLMELQRKYDVTNKEMAHELKQAGIKSSESGVSRKLSGERKIEPCEFELMLQVIRPTAAEEHKLRRLYRIRQFGEKEYVEVQRIRDYIQQFADDATVIFTDTDIQLESVSNILDDTTMTAVIFRLLSEVWGREPIRIFCQPEYKPLIDILMFLSRSQPAEVEHLVCLNNDKSNSNIYNIECLSVLDKLVIRNIRHSVRYFYDLISSKLNCFNLFPFFILAGNRALFISWDFKTGYLAHEPKLVQRVQSEFARMYHEGKPLFEIAASDVRYMQLCMEIERDVYKEHYLLQYHPCVAFNGDLELTGRCIHDAYEGKDAFLEMFALRWSQRTDVRSFHLHTREGREDFLRTGMTSDMNPQIFRALTPEERGYVLNRIMSDQKHTAHEIKDTFIKVPPPLSLFCSDSGRCLISYKDNRSAPRLIMRERSLHRSMMHFFRYVLKYETTGSKPPYTSK